MNDWCAVHGADVLLRLRIQPRAAHEGIAGVRAGRLLVRVSAPPVDGAANQRLIEILARALAVPRATLEIARGTASRDKNVLIRAAAARQREFFERLSAHCADASACG